MSDHHENSDDTDVSRRTFMKASSVAVGASALGVGAAGAASAADGELDKRFLNWRTVEAQKVWDRGYRGRPDRAVGINETGADTRHPDLGPWNGVLIEKDGSDIDLKQVTTETEELPVEDPEEFASVELESSSGAEATNAWTRDFWVEDPRETPETFDTVSFSGEAAGVFGAGFAPFEDFTLEEQDGSDYDAAIKRYRIDATLTWEPENPVEGTSEPVIAEFEIQDSEENTIESSSPGASGLRNADNERRIIADVEPGNDYRIRVYPERGVTSFEVNADLQVVLDEPRINADADDVLDTEVEVTGRWNRQLDDAGEADVEVTIFEDDSRTPVESTSTGGTGVTFTTDGVEPGQAYYIESGTRGGATVTAEFEVSIRGTEKVFDENGNVVTEPQTVYEVGEFSGDPVPSADTDITAETPKTIGWYNTGRYLDSNVPRDPNGHGTHVSSIAAGSGRASTIDFRNTTVEEPRAVLLPGDFVEYEVEAEAGTTVFASAFGEGVQVDIVNPDGEVVHEAPLRGDSVIADQPVLDGGMYTIRARPYETESSTDAAERAQEGNPAAGRLNRIAFGTYRHPPDTAGARVPTDEPRAVHPGMAPNASIVTLEGYLQPSADFNEIADDLTETFNVRTMNHSWGFPYGVPWGQFGGAGGPVWDTVVDVLLNGGPSTERILEGIEKATEEGILNVAAAGNSFTPANGNSLPAVAEEAVSVVATGPFDGITSYSSGGVGGTDTDQEDFHAKPDVTAPGGDVKPDVATLLAGVSAPSRIEFVRAAMAPESGYDDGGELGDPPRDYVSVAGTSMASPYTCGVSTLIAQAMEEDAPDTIALPEPAATGFDDAMRLKQVLLATASETVFTAAPYHTAKNVASAPQYTHGERDPYEGYGRVNPDAAVDAVSRNLLGTDPSLGDDTYEATYEESVGTYVPEDSRAVAGYVKVPGGDLAVSVDFTDYIGGNRGMAKGTPHLDLFVYDAETPAENGEPNIVTSARGEQGAASVSVSVDRGDRDDPTERTFFVVAKIVNIPGVVNGFDIRANFEFAVSFDPADEFPPTAVDLNAQGGRSDDGDVFTAGQTNRVEVTIENFNTELTDEVRLLDSSPWTVDTAYGDAESYDPETGEVDLGTVTASDLPVTRAYFAEAPDTTGRYGFGPARAKAVDPADFSDDPDRTQGSTEEDISGTDVNTVVGADTEVN